MLRNPIFLRCKRRTSSPSHRKETVQGVDCLRKYVGKHKVSFHYRHLDGSNERLVTADLGDQAVIANAERVAKRRALEIQSGTIVADPVADVIRLFREKKVSVTFSVGRATVWRCKTRSAGRVSA
ncbi:hypothetical protein RO07_18910 [Pandoraea pulmonicola]|uniref:Uncharacterized protein n=1 Tax=Pandoraea pulmonicola TaxID=93221 RepID=A0AAJ4Z8Y9_PANPU|nr:hypothetical protein RO07_18910 [Pandoraea pulmonicola]SUA88975.1 Uncharacterised protein [Pandoraea pulmonicola]